MATVAQWLKVVHCPHIATKSHGLNVVNHLRQCHCARFGAMLAQRLFHQHGRTQPSPSRCVVQWVVVVVRPCFSFNLWIWKVWHVSNVVQFHLLLQPCTFLHIVRDTNQSARRLHKP